jgi:hypothetical protein
MTKALLINGAESSIIEIDGIDGIRGYFAGKGDFIGKTLPSDGEICVRQWKSVNQDPEGIEIFAAYDRMTRKPVDLPSEFEATKLAEVKL